MPRRRLLILGALTLAIAVPAVIAGRGCAATYPNRDPTGEPFPTVTGNSLEKEQITLPDAYAGRPAVVLVGYQQRTQFDLDRWLLGLLQAGAPDHATIVEVPTIPGLAPSLASGWIDDGMRSGIPPEDWGSVVTLYGDAARPVAEFTGNEEGQRSRVLVLDAGGTVVWFDDGAYSASKAIAVTELLESMAVLEGPGGG